MDPDAVDELSERDTPPPATTADRAVSTRTGHRVPHGQPGEPGVLDFGTVVNSVAPDGVARVYEAALAASRSHPADDYSGLRAAAATYLGTDATAVIPAAGAAVGIRLAIATSVTAGDSVLIPEPAIQLYEREVKLQGATPEFCAYEDIPEIDPSEYELVILDVPQNPTGAVHSTVARREFIERCRAVETPVLVDESDIGLTDLTSLAGEPGVMVVHSIARVYGLPGLRIGYIVATGTLRDRLETSRPPCGLGTPAVAVGKYCLDQRGFRTECQTRLAEERSRMADRLDARFDVTAGDGPFVLLELDSSDAVDELLLTLRASDILVHDAREMRGLDRHVRITVRLPRENDVLLSALDV